MRLTRKDYSITADKLAPSLLGCFICKKTEGIIQRFQIVETECYCGESDTACHARNGKTPRNAPMYGLGGHTYIYLCYGIHSLLNVVAGEVGSPEAVLIRGIDGAIGPGRVTKKLEVNLTHNNIDLTTSDTLWIEKEGRLSYKTAPRVGIDYASTADKERLWRFIAVKE